MASRDDILKVFNEIEKTFLWRGQWIITDEWTKHIKTCDGMGAVTLRDVNMVLKKVAGTASQFIAELMHSQSSLYVTGK
jgi:hypothetical protein